MKKIKNYLNSNAAVLITSLITMIIIVIMVIYNDVNNIRNNRIKEFLNYIQMIEYQINENEELINKSGNEILSTIQPQLNNYISRHPDLSYSIQYFYKQKIEKTDNEVIYTVPITNGVCEYITINEFGSCIKKQNHSIYKIKFILE